ncbi:type IV toxin-antitoxin system AbiEi family antitoxin domain-containing protein [Gordonia sp. DT219]|uniref:type IV toxin-antitoxin system AbiEi family antitoxin domain-containing protein n=1 Tax=Gordonia sp. DT219 TaxID=3416658 RepID=UPI003CF346E7
MTVEDVRDDRPVASPDMALLGELFDRQEGVVARRQVIECGYSAPFIRRKVRRNEWAVVYPGVYVDHTGPLTWQHRAWSAVLDAFPAALSHVSAVSGGHTSAVSGGHTSAVSGGHASAVDDGQRAPSEPIHIVVDRARRVTQRSGVVVHYGSGLDDKVLWHAQPPRVRTEEALLDIVGATSSEMSVVACLADAVGARKTTADRLLVAVRRRTRLRHRAFVEKVLCDVRDGTCSVLERGYLTRVERAHGLPSPQRQAPTTADRRGLRDVDYGEWGVVVELDGRAWHDSARDRDRDMERDLDAAVGAARLTLRLGWGQVYDRPCVTARKVARALSAGGWTGSASRCARCP